MSYIQITIHTAHEDAERIAEGLEFLGALSITMTDAQDTPVFQLDPGETPLWPELKITALFDDTVSPRDVIANLKKHLNITTPVNYRIEKLADQDWVRLTQQHFKPQHYANHLWICPQWYDEPLEGTVVRIDPGLAFGTGTHPTTQLCLEWLAQHAPINKTVLDYGCGSGILSLGALGLGAEQVDAVDHDEQALIATQNNAALNTSSMDVSRLAGYFPNQLPHDKQYDVVVANILANPLITLKETLCGHLKNGGKLILSGILEQEITTIVQTYESTVELESADTLDQWARLVFIKQN
jgi:ribosomal protein L11 methyltransferase